MPPFSRLARVSKRHNLPWYQALVVESFVRLYRRALFRRILRPFFRPKRPLGIFFVVGCYNSGTTVIKNAISLHPDVATAPIEGDRLTGALLPYETGGWPRCLFGNCHEVVTDRRHGKVDADLFWSDLRPWIDTHKYFLEKSISNTVRIPLLRKAFPGTRFICVVRDVEGVVQGIQRRSRPYGLARKILGASEYSHELLSRQWRFFYSLVLEDMSTEKDIYFCSYEKFISEPDTEVAKLYEFLGLSPQPLAYRNSRLSVGERSLEIHSESTLGERIDSASRLHEKLESIS